MVNLPRQRNRKGILILTGAKAPTTGEIKMAIIRQKDSKHTVQLTGKDLDDYLASRFEDSPSKVIDSLLEKYGLPSDFWNEGVKIAMNMNSGYVFLTNEDYQVAMLEGDELVSFYNSPYAGIEGTFEELKEEYQEMHPRDKEWFVELGNNLNLSIQ